MSDSSSVEDFPNELKNQTPPTNTLLKEEQLLQEPGLQPPSDLDTTKKIEESTKGTTQYTPQELNVKDEKLYKDNEKTPTSEENKQKPKGQKIKETTVRYPETGVLFILEVLGTLTKYVWEVFMIALNIIKPFLALYLVVVFVVWNINIGTSSVYQLVDQMHSAVCRYPLVGNILDCRNVTQQSNIPNFSELVEKQGTVYSEILTQLTQSEVPLPLELKKAELAVTDLKTTIRYSKLDSTGLLVEHLNNFQQTAKKVGREIQYLQAKATTGLDKFVIHNSYLLRYLDRMDGSIYGSWMDYIVPSFLGPSKNQVQEMYLTSMETARSDVRDLILLAQGILGGLDKLDSILNGVYEISTREKNLQQIQKDELLAELWSILGGNKIQRKFFEENLTLLQQLDTQRHLALNQVQVILMKLTELQADLEVLKEQVSHPLIEDIPLRVHIQTIENLLTRVRNQQLIPAALTSANPRVFPSNGNPQMKFISS